ncbi:hypothetical protein TVAG_322760 [Trichomonas vaginalis G3]|uniref:AAA+ ATPase domain-containing protein n=1 Tax=Trichomonas vaginalis (strain ATCC PRA-98 / G3) TaxID=412133 RepID=A2EL28_TRIV3|nr:midasin-related family [Trichomonas vaginalis G3]EAY06656.1 hypothetical protein TVAG_322760 [Trichomonas vaginalis G3]KAI5552867.1 midasin-related family [Trichomonas vaginalis G3]|eukprot:XP_001318879.1 hypothetical protein [Trichomonas vaginalis G3]
MNEIIKFTNSGIPVLLIGPTGCGKTTIAEKIFDNPNGFLKFNFSSETTIDQLIGNLTLDKDSNPKFEYGTFSKAFKEGIPLILDEFNLAHEDVLQCIESSLDTEELFVDDPSLNNAPIKMHPAFKLIATQNDSDSSFASMRNKLTSKLTSHFQVIQFEDFTDDQLTVLCSNFNKEISEETIDKVISFHYSCFNDSNKDYSFTIRNLKMALLSTDDEKDLYRSLLYYYEPLMGQDKAFLIPQKLSENEIIQTDIPDIDINQMIQDKHIQNVWKNEILISTLRKIQFFMKNHQPILIVGPDGSGKTQIAKWASQLFSNNGSLFMVCHPEMTTSDLMGGYTTSSNSLRIADWKDGPIIKAASKGLVLIIDQLESASPQVIERINPILDAYSNILLNEKTQSTNNTKFNVPECFEDLQVEINKDFKIIATASKSQLKNLSPALKNRFTIVEINSQIDKEDSNQQIQELVSALIESNQGNNISINYLVIKRLVNINNISDISKIVSGIRLICSKYPQFNDVKIQIQVFEALYDIYINHKTPQLDRSIIDIVLKTITGETKGFYFKESPELENIVSLIILMQNIGQHIVLQSGTGFGKTSVAVALAKGLKFNPYKVSFNAETKLSDLIGNITITRGTSDNSKGQLLRAIKEGGFFIADEANLADNTILQSLVIALEQKPGEEIEIPSEGTTKIHEKYFFIACQNDSTMFGRKPLPQVLLKRVVCFEYPFPESSLFNVIKEITSEYKLSLMNKLLTNFVKLLYNEFKHNEAIRPWSFREIRRFCKRVTNSEQIEIFRNKKWNIANPEEVQIYHALFMSWMMCPVPEQASKTISEIVEKSFQKVNSSELENILLSNAVPQGKYVVKGNIRIKSVASQSNNEEVIQATQGIASFWNAVFLSSLIPSNEPILIVGESSFKTYLANSIMANPSQVTLGSETTTASLIGQVSYVRQQTYDQAMLDLLHTIMISNPKLYKDFRDFKKNFIRDKEHLDKLQEFIKQLKVPFLQKSIDHITKQLIADEPDPSKVHSAISNYTTIFKPGLITHQIFSQSPIVIKNFSKPPTSVIERFNELIDIEPELTLNEDYTNTITPPDYKVIKMSNSDKTRFRIVALSSLIDYNRISEAMRSRFNIVNIKKYSNEKIKTITGFSDEYIKDFNFHQLVLMKSIITKIQEIHRTILNSSQEIPREELEREAARIMGTEDVGCKEFISPLQVDNGHLKSDNPYILSYSAPNFDPSKTNIVFTKTTQTMCDRIFTALSFDIPIIIQGPTGTCKSMLADYVANSIKDFANNNHVIKIQLSRSTTVEDLFGRNSIKVDKNGNKTFDYIPTELFKAATEGSPHRSLIIIEELNLASPSLIDALTSLFDNNPNSKIMKTNGESENKGKYSIIGIASGNVPPALKKASIFFKRDVYTNNEMRAVCSPLLKAYESSKFINYFTTLNPRNCIMFVQLIYSFNSSDQNMHLLLDLVTHDQKSKSNEWESIPISHESRMSILKVDKIKVECSTIGNKYDPKIKEKLLSLTASEQKLFVTLAANTHKRFPLIVTGGTASGKTYAIQLFAQAINKKLHVIPLNADTSISTITGSYKPSKFVNQANIDKITSKLKEDPAFDDVSILIREYSKNRMEIKKLQEIEAQINIVLENTSEEKHQKIGNEAKSLVSTAKHLINNLEYSESSLVTAMKNGDWILFDGVESCPSTVMERIITLLDFEPSLNLYEVDEGVVYSSKPSSYQQHKIQDGFRIILTYNNVGTHKKTPLSQSILSRCAILKMDPIDSDTKSTSKISLFELPDKKYELPDGSYNKSNIVARIAKLHDEMKKLQKDGSSYELTGRSISRICRLFTSMSVNTEGEFIPYQQIKKALLITYNNMISKMDEEDDETNQKILEIFEQAPDDQEVENLNELYKQTFIESSKLKQMIEESLLQDGFVSNIFSIIERALFKDVFDLDEFMIDLTQKFKDLHANDFENRETKWYADYIFLSQLQDIIHSLSKLDDNAKSEISHFSISSISQIKKELAGILTKFAFISQTCYSCQDISIPIEFTSEVNISALNGISDEVKNNIFKFPFLYFSIPGIEKISKFFDGIYKLIFDTYIYCFAIYQTDFRSSLDHFVSIIYEVARPSNTININDLVESLSLDEFSSLISLKKSFKEYSNKFEIPCEFMDMLNQLQIKFDELNIISEDEKKWNKLKEDYPDLGYLFTLTEGISWVPKSNIQNTIINLAKMEKPISYNKLSLYVNQIDPNNCDKSRWFSILMDYSYDITLLENLKNPKKCISSLLKLNERKYNVGKILKTFNGTYLTVSQSDADALINDMLARYLENMYAFNDSLLDVGNLIEKVDSYINKVELVSNDWAVFVRENNKKYDINQEIMIPKYTEPSIRRFLSKECGKNFKSKKDLLQHLKEDQSKEFLYSMLINQPSMKKYNTSDRIQFEDYEEWYIENFPAQGLFLLRNPDFIKLIEIPNERLTFGLFMLRVVSSFKQITFETTKFTPEMSKSINDSIQKLLLDPDNNKGIIVALCLSNPPYSLKHFYTCLLHDSLVQAATFLDDDQYVKKANMLIGEYLEQALSNCNPLTKQKWSSFIGSNTDYLLNPIKSFINFCNFHISDKLNELKAFKDKTEKELKMKEDKINEVLPELEKATKKEDPNCFIQRFRPDNYSENVINAYESYSSCLLTILNSLTKFEWYKKGTQIKDFDQSIKLYKFIKKLKYCDPAHYEEQIYVIYIHNCATDTITFTKKDDQDVTVSFYVRPKVDSFLVVPEKYINDIDVPKSLETIKLNVSKMAEVTDEINVDMLIKAYRKFYDEKVKDPNAMDSYYASGSTVIFNTSESNYNFDDIKDLFKNTQSGISYLTEFESKFMKPQFEGNPDQIPEKTQEIINKIHLLVKEHDRLVTEIRKYESEIALLPTQRFDPPSEQSSKPDIKLNKTNNITIDFSNTDSSVFNLAAINITNDSVNPSFRMIKADIPGILRGIQTTPICIPIYVFGNASKIRIKFYPLDETPLPAYEINESQVNLLFPINGITNDIIFTGMVDINTHNINYEVKAHFIDSTIFIDSPGNSFIKDTSGISFEKSFIEEDSIPIISTIPGLENPKQTILVENINTAFPKSPIQFKDDDQTFIIKGLTHDKKENKISGIAFNCYHTSNEDSRIIINSPDFAEKRNVDLRILSPPYKLLSEKSEMEIGNCYNKYYFVLCFIMKYAETPRIDVKCSDNVKILNQNIFPTFSVPQSHVVIGVEMKSIAKRYDDPSSLILSINSQQFQWTRSIKLFTKKPDKRINFDHSYVLYNSINYSLHENNKYIPRVYYDEKFGTILTNNTIKCLIINDHYQVDYLNYNNNIKDKCVLLSWQYYVDSGKNEVYWIPAFVPGTGEIQTRILQMSEDNVNDLLNFLRRFFGKNSIVTIKNIIRNFKGWSQKCNSICEFIMAQLTEKYNKIINDDYQLTNDVSFDVGKINSLRENKFDQGIINKHIRNVEDDTRQDALKLLPSKNTTILMQYTQDESKLSYESKIITQQERNDILESISKMTSVEPKLELEMVPNTENIRDEVIFKTITSAKAIYDRISEVVPRCRKFLLMMANYADYTKEFPVEKAQKEIRYLAAFHKWSSDKRTLKSTPFLTQCIEFNNGFTSLINIMQKAGCKIENINIETTKLTPLIIKPSQSPISVEEFRKEWTIQRNVSVSLYLPSFSVPPIQPNPKPNPPAPPRQNKKLYKGDNATINIKYKPDSNGTSGRTQDKPEDIYKFMIKNIDKIQYYQDDAKEFNSVVSDIKDIPEKNNLPIDEFIAYTTETTYQIIKEFNSKTINMDSEIVLMLDIKSITPNSIKLDNFLYFIAFAMAISQLGFSYRLLAFADRNFQYFEIKKLSEKLQRKHLQVALEILDTKRTCADPLFSIKSIIKQDIEKSFSFFVFTDGNLLNTNYTIWQEWDNGTNSRITYFLKPPNEEEYKVPIIKQYKTLKKNHNNINYAINMEGFNHNKEFIDAFINGISTGNGKVHRIDRNVELKLSENDSNIPIVCSFKKLPETDSQFVCISEVIQASITRQDEVMIPNVSEYISPTNKSEFELETFRQNIEANWVQDELFPPNKPMQYIPSEKGNGLSMAGLIRFIITDGQDQRFRLDKCAGYVPNYSLFFVIDCSESSSGILSLQATRQTVFSTLLAFKDCEFPITIILATSDGPAAVCINKKKEEIFVENSPVFTEIYRLLTESHGLCSFSQALIAAFNLRYRQTEQESILIGITNGNFTQHEMDAVGTAISSLQSIRTYPIGVGVGITPTKISKVFTKSIWSSNPLSIANCFQTLLEFDPNECKTKGKISDPALPNKIPKLNELHNILISKQDRTYTELTDKLTDILFFDSAEDSYMNEKPEIQKLPTSKPGSEIYDQELPNVDLGENKAWPYNILICMLYGFTASNDDSDKYVTYKTLTDKNGIVKGLRELKFNVGVTKNYCDSIAELSSGKYHQVWVICSKGQRAKPTDVPDISEDTTYISKKIKGNKDDFDHAYQFVETVELFRQNGGGVAFWADQGFTFELNYFLKHVKLYDCDKIEKEKNQEKIPIKLRFHDGDPVKEKVLQRRFPKNFTKMSFDADDYKWISNYKYYLYGYNVSKLMEGTTIAGARIPEGLSYDQICDHIKPFRPFSLSSEKGLVSGCYYVAPKFSNEGDIIIDGASSRLFKELNLEGVKRLVRNMACCLINKKRYIAETGSYIDKLPVPLLKIPKIPVEKPIDCSKIKIKPIDLVYIYDATQSTNSIKNTIYYQIENSIDWFKYSIYDVRIAAIAFRDYALAVKEDFNIERNLVDVIDFKDITDASEILEQIRSFPCKGGMGDGPEDWNSAFEQYFTLKFRENSTKIVFFITDNGTHHPDFHRSPVIDGDDYSSAYYSRLSNYEIDDYIISEERMSQQQKLEYFIDRLAKQNPFWILCPFGRSATHPLNTFRKSLINRNNNTKSITITFRSFYPKNWRFNPKKIKLIDHVKLNPESDEVDGLSNKELNNIYSDIFKYVKAYIEEVVTMF